MQFFVHLSLLDLTDLLLFVFFGAVSLLFGLHEALGIMNTILTADTSAAVSSEKSGQVFGILEAAQNVCGMVGPILGGLLTKYLSPPDMPHYAALYSVLVLYGLAFLFIFFGYDSWVLGVREANLMHPWTSLYKHKDRNL